MAGQEKAWSKSRAGLGESSLFSLATSLASARLKSLLLSILSVTDESELPLDVTWVSLGSNEAIEAIQNSGSRRNPPKIQGVKSPFLCDVESTRIAA
jgi:hypothetical protein